MPNSKVGGTFEFGTTSENNYFVDIWLHPIFTAVSENHRALPITPGGNAYELEKKRKKEHCIEEWRGIVKGCAKKYLYIYFESIYGL